MKFIKLERHEFRCRPGKGWQQIINDCGHQHHCARRQAANTVGAPEDDLSRDAAPYVGGVMLCPHYMSFETAAGGPMAPAKRWVSDRV